MRVQSFQEMLVEYGDAGLESDDIDQRSKLLSNHKYSVIVEGEYMEFDNLEKWIKVNIGEDAVKELWYGKTGYDYGFSEFFLNDDEHILKLTAVIPNVYTIYPNAYPPPGLICRSDGYSVRVFYDPTNKDAMVFRE